MKNKSNVPGGTVRISIIIPNWNGVHLMQKHLAQVIRASRDAEVIVSDDMSTDGSVEFLHSTYPRVKVVERTRREGFAANVNAGVRAATGEILVLLNTDVEPENGFLTHLLRHFSDTAVFAVGCLEKSHEQDGVVLRGRGIGGWNRGYYIHSRGDTDKPDTAWVSGGSGAFRKSMWDRLGGMDTLYNPFYWEDIDLSYRARKSGWKTMFEPKSIVHHYHEEGKIKKEFTPEDVKRIVYRNQFIFIWKNLSDPSLMFEHALWTPVRLMQAVFRGDWLMVQGYVSALMYLSAIIHKRTLQHGMYTKQDSEIS